MKKPVDLEQERVRRTRAEKELEASHESLLIVLDSLEAIVYVTDISTYELLFVSKYVKDLFGDITGRICWKSLQVDQTGPCSFCTNKFLLDSAGTPRGVYHWEFQNTVNGHWYDIRDRAVRWFDGRIVRLEIAIDITNRKHAEEEIRVLNNELEKRVASRTQELTALNRELESFAYTVSHDLRAPLRSIDAFSEALITDYQSTLDGEARDFLRRIRAAARKMSDLIDDLLRLSRLSRASMRRRTVDLSAIMREIGTGLSAAQPERLVELRIEPAVYASADAELIRVALENLLGNSWKFTSAHDSARIEFGEVQENDERVFFVRDDGAGFDMAYSNKLFGAFQRLHDAREFPGSGIGLATVQRIVKRHGGRVWASGAVEKGATFFFTLPEPGLPQGDE